MGGQNYLLYLAVIISHYISFQSSSSSSWSSFYAPAEGELAFITFIISFSTLKKSILICQWIIKKTSCVFHKRLPPTRSKEEKTLKGFDTLVWSLPSFFQRWSLRVIIPEERPGPVQACPKTTVKLAALQLFFIRMRIACILGGKWRNKIQMQINMIDGMFW